MFAGYIPAIQTLGVNIQNAKNMHRMRSVVYFIIACINVILSVWLISKWGVIGTCLGTLFATLLGHGLFMNWYYNKKIGLNILYFWKEMIHWIIPVFLMTVTGKLIVSQFVIDSWFKLIAIACVYSCVYIVILYLIGFDNNQKNSVKVKLKTIFAK